MRRCHAGWRRGPATSARLADCVDFAGPANCTGTHQNALLAPVALTAACGLGTSPGGRATRLIAEAVVARDGPKGHPGAA